MKKKGLVLATALFISTLGLTVFTSCDDDTNSYLQVKVIDDTNKRPIPGAITTVTADGSAITKEVTTDNAGISTFMFYAPAVFNITATQTIDSLSNSQRIAYRDGSSSARLKDGDTVFVTISVAEEIKYKEKN